MGDTGSARHRAGPEVSRRREKIQEARGSDRHQGIGSRAGTAGNGAAGHQDVRTQKVPRR